MRRNWVPSSKKSKSQRAHDALGSNASWGLLVVEEVSVMKRTLAVLGVLAAASVAPAHAADLSRPVYKAPPPVTAPVPVYSWSGFYIGGHAGAGWESHDGQNFSVPSMVAPVPLGSNSDTGFVGGGQIGYNWQFAPNWLLGIEGDFSGADIKNSSTAVLPSATVSMTRDLNWLASVRGR